MFFLEPTGWLDGGSALFVVLISGFFGLLSFYKAIKLKIKLLGITGLTIFSVGFVLLGPATDFLVILSTGYNMNPYWLYGLLSYSWTAPVTIFGLYIGAELIKPEKKWHILSVYIALSVIFEIILFYNSFTNPAAIFIYPLDPHGTELLNTGMVLISPAFILMLIFLISGLIFNGFGFLNKSLKSSGILKRKFFYLSLGWFLFIICGALDGVFNIITLVFFLRIGTALSVIFMYLGIRVKG